MTAFLEVIKKEADNELKDLRWMIPTGEALRVRLVRDWYKYYPDIKLINAYGPTEASDDVSHYVIHEVPAEDSRDCSCDRPDRLREDYDALRGSEDDLFTRR